jgi:hypothetical protein
MGFETHDLLLAKPGARRVLDPKVNRSNRFDVMPAPTNADESRRQRLRPTLRCQRLVIGALTSR